MRGTRSALFPPSKINHHWPNPAAVLAPSPRTVVWLGIVRRLLFLFLQLSVLGLVTRAFPKLSAQIFSSSISLSPSSVGTSVVQDTRHLLFSRHPHLCRFDPSTPIPNGTDTCQPFVPSSQSPMSPPASQQIHPRSSPDLISQLAFVRVLLALWTLVRNAWRSLSTRGHDLGDQNEDDGVRFLWVSMYS